MAPLRAVMDIPKHTELGRFCGDEMFKFEYNKVQWATCYNPVDCNRTHILEGHF